MRRALLTLSLVVALGAHGAWAQDFDPGQCSRIQDVDVPYDVTTRDRTMSFAARSGAIVVSAQAIEANGRSHASPAVAAYHQRLGVFLAQAEATARAMNPLARERAGMGESAISMCQAILDLAASAAVIEAEFEGYSSPVRIRLR